VLHPLAGEGHKPGTEMAGYTLWNDLINGTRC